MPATILVVEDEPAIQELIAYNLRQAGHEPMRAETAEQALNLVRNALPDLVLLDWMLPGQSGIEFAKRMKADRRTRDVPIIMLTARAEDYLTKPFAPRELLARINAVLRRSSAGGADDTLEAGGLVLDPASHRVTAGDSPVMLGPTEFRLLHYLMTHAERVHSRVQLLDQVWGDHVFVEERTVDVHIRRLRKALEATGHDSLVQTVRGSGYRLSASP